MAATDRDRRWVRRLIVVVVALAVLAVGIPFVYFHFIQGKAPAPFSLSTAPTSTLKAGETSAPLAGTWKVTTGSRAGYRVRETLDVAGISQHNTAVARTDGVTGSMTIAGTQLTKATITVDMTKMASVTNSLDAPLAHQRDDQFQGRIMDTADFPTATFVLTKPIDLAPVPKNGVQRPYSAVGKLTLHGATKTVTMPVNARRTANLIEVQGILPVTFADYGIGNPSGGPASVGDAGQMEFQVELAPA